MTSTRIPCLSNNVQDARFVSPERPKIRIEFPYICPIPQAWQTNRTAEFAVAACADQRTSDHETSLTNRCSTSSFETCQ